ncbi:MAG: hypothetical protein GY953_43735, partial [bacterium]|nr:hypothetical protein [bacterium]
TATVTLLPANFSTIRINSGGGAYTDPQGNTWSADTAFSGGSAQATGSPIPNTNSDPLYQTARYGSLAYSLPVPNGSYLLNLKFADLVASQPGQRLFDATVNGQPVLTDFDVVEQAGGPLRALDFAVPIEVSAGLIDIELLPRFSSPQVNAIEILPTAARSPMGEIVTPMDASPQSDDPSPQPPQAVSATSLGGGRIRLDYEDPNGYEEIGWAFVLLHTRLAQDGGCYVQYNHSRNTLWLMNDAGTAWLGPVSVGSPDVLDNNQCTVEAQGASASASGTTLSLELSGAFKPGFTGTKDFYMYAADTTGLNSGWQARGSFSTSDPQAPEAVSVSPSQGSGASQTFRLVYSDVNGFQEMGWVFALLNSQVNQSAGCYLQYNHTRNTLWLRNDAGAAWLGPVPLGAPGTLSFGDGGWSHYTLYALQKARVFLDVEDVGGVQCTIEGASWPL